MKRSRYTEEQIIGILKEQEAGVPVVELCCKHGMSDATFYSWKSKYGGLDVARQSGCGGSISRHSPDSGDFEPRLAVVAFASAAAADVVLLAGGVLLTRVSTRSAVSRSVSRVATATRSVLRRASRSLIFIFSALIWSSIVGVVVGMVAFSGFRSIGMIELGGVYHRNAGFSTIECADPFCW